MLAPETIYETFGFLWCSIFIAIGFKGFIRTKQFFKLPLLLFIFFLFCLPKVSHFLYLFVLIELSVIGTNILKFLGKLTGLIIK